MSQSSNPPQSAPADKNARLRQGVLLIVLVVGIGLLYYDRNVARPASDAGYRKLTELLERRMVTEHGKDRVSPDDVQKALGFAPSTTEKKNDSFLLETYRWRGGLPIRSYNVYAIYRGVDAPVLENVFQNEYPPDEFFPNTVAIPAVSGPVPSGGASGANAKTPPSTGPRPATGADAPIQDAPGAPGADGPATKKDGA